MLRDRRFLRLWTGTTASGLATWALPFLLGLAVLDGDLGGKGLGVVLAARTVGFLLAVPLAGVLADRHSRRGVVLWSGLIGTVAALLIAYGIGGGSLLMTVGGGFLAGISQGACRPAFQALTAEVVAPEHRHQANAMITLAVRASVLVGPACSALLATMFSPAVLIAGTSTLWLCSALTPPPGARTKQTSPPPREPFLAELTAGVHEARRHPWFLAGLGALTTVIATGYSVTAVALPLISKDRYGTEVVLVAATTGYTVGALLGALLLAKWRPPSQGWTAMLGLGLYGFAPLSLILPVHPAVIVIAYVITGIGIELFNVPWFTAAQREVDPAKLARVSSVDFLLSYGLAPLGLALIAPALATFGTTPVLTITALLCFAAPAAVTLLVPSARHFRTERPGEGRDDHTDTTSAARDTRADTGTGT